MIGIRTGNFLIHSIKTLITWTPPPEIITDSEKVAGEKDPEDRPAGWIAVVMEDNVVFSEAPLMVMLCRPGKDRALADKKMRAAKSLNESMPVQMVYIKTSPSAVTIKARLKALDKHRHYNNQSPAFDEKRRVLVGRDLSVHRQDDSLDGIPEEKIEEVTTGLNPSQLECLKTHCREVHHGINLILGPFGSDKTVLVKSSKCPTQKPSSPRVQTAPAMLSSLSLRLPT